MTASLQGVVPVVKAIKVVFYEPCYTEVMKFYTELYTIGYADRREISRAVKSVHGARI